MTVPQFTAYYLEIITNEVSSSRAFYEELYGWKFEPMGPQMGNSFVANLPNGSLCGIRAPMHDQEKPIVRVYVRVDDIEKVSRRAVELGAFLAMSTMEIPGKGKIAIYIKDGIEQGLWQTP